MAEGNSFKGIIELDIDNKILDINHAAMTILGLSHDDFRHRRFPDVLANDPRVCEVIQDYMADPGAAKNEIAITKQGKSYIFKLELSESQVGGKNNTRLLQLIDISDQKQRDDFSAILNSFKDYYFETDLTGVITNINKAFCEHLGYTSREEVIGKHFRHFTNRESVREVYHNFTKVIEEKKEVTLFNYSYRTADGQLHVGETTLSPIFQLGDVIGARGVLRDITDRLKAEADLLAAKNELESRAEELIAINRIAMICGQSLNLDLILQKVCDELVQIFPIKSVGIRIITQSKDSFMVVAFHSIEPETREIVGTLLPFRENEVVGLRGEIPETAILPNSQLYISSAPAQVDAVSKARLYSMTVPLLVRGAVIGFVDILSKEPDYVFNEKQKKLAEIIANQVAAAVNNAHLYRQTKSALDVTEHDLEIGRKVQSTFFPEKIPNIPGWEIAAYFKPARQVAGDFYDFFPLENSNLVAIVIGDVCDKGVGAALFMVLCRSLLRAYSALEINPRQIRQSMKNIVVRTNNYIEKYHGSSSSYSTLFFGVLDPDHGQLYYINGGHEPLALLNREGKLIRRIAPTGPAVGLIPDANYKVDHIDFTPGDFLVGFTDGIQDTLDAQGRSFSAERLLNYVQIPWTSLFSMVFDLRIELDNFMGGQQQFDDITIVSIRRKVSQDAEQHMICRYARPEILDEILQFVESAAQQCEQSAERISDFKQAAEIACKRIFQSGVNGEKPGLVSIAFEKTSAEVNLIIRDDGEFIPSLFPSIPDPVMSNGNHTGLRSDGIMLHDLMDRVTYQKMAVEGNELILGKKNQAAPR